MSLDQSEEVVSMTSIDMKKTKIHRAFEFFFFYFCFEMFDSQRFFFIVFIVFLSSTFVFGRRLPKCSPTFCSLPSCQCAMANANPTTFEVSQIPQLVQKRFSSLPTCSFHFHFRLDSSDVRWKSQ